MDTVLASIKKLNLISYDDRVLVALSGGADSVVLLHALKQLGHKVFAAHINHMIRGEEALRDELFAASLCDKLEVPLAVYKKDCPEYAMAQKLTIEEAARILRYEALEQACKAFGCQKIAVAHTENDNLETMLMRLIRGSSSYGLRGIDIQRGLIIRPLLHLRREDIEEYAKKHDLSYMTDSTNKDMCYLRNRIRHMLLPELESSYNPNIRATLTRLSESLKTDADYFAAEVRRLYDKFVATHNDGITISQAAFDELHPAILDRVIRLSAESVSGSGKDFEHVHTMMVKSLFEKKSGKKISLTKGLAAANSFGDVTIYRVKSPIDTTQCLNSGDFVQVGETQDFISMSTKKINSKENLINTCTGAFSCDKIMGNLVIRGRQDGDLIVKPCGREIKYKDFLIERRVPVFMRDNIYVVACGSRVLMALSPVDYAAPPVTEAKESKIYLGVWRKSENHE